MTEKSPYASNYDLGNTLPSLEQHLSIEAQPACGHITRTILVQQTVRPTRVVPCTLNHRQYPG